ncbi:hypothetical protein [Pyrobaculum sp.]|uniref:hypothetical protein n=1 Tax=Pyrobaculum sp. TaxID=2004705 RepID=UPI003D0BE6A5
MVSVSFEPLLITAVSDRGEELWHRAVLRVRGYAERPATVKALVQYSDGTTLPLEVDLTYLGDFDFYMPLNPSAVYRSGATYAPLSVSWFGEDGRLLGSRAFDRLSESVPDSYFVESSVSSLPPDLNDLLIHCFYASLDKNVYPVLRPDGRFYVPRIPNPYAPNTTICQVAAQDSAPRLATFEVQYNSGRGADLTYPTSFDELSSVMAVLLDHLSYSSLLGDTGDFERDTRYLGYVVQNPSVYQNVYDLVTSSTSADMELASAELAQLAGAGSVVYPSSGYASAAGVASLAEKVGAFLSRAVGKPIRVALATKGGRVAEQFYVVARATTKAALSGTKRALSSLFASASTRFRSLATSVYRAGKFAAGVGLAFGAMAMVSNLATSVAQTSTANACIAVTEALQKAQTPEERAALAEAAKKICGQQTYQQDDLFSLFSTVAVMLVLVEVVKSFRER